MNPFWRGLIVIAGSRQLARIRLYSLPTVEVAVIGRSWDGPPGSRVLGIKVVIPLAIASRTSPC